MITGIKNKIHHSVLKMNSLASQKGFNRYFKNTSWLFAEKILRMIASLLVGVWVARYLGPGQYGLLSYAQSFVALFAAIATLGLDGIIIRELVKDDSKKDELVGTAFWLKAIGSIAMVGLIAITISFTNTNAYTKNIILIIAFGTIFQAFNVIDFYFQAKVLGRFIALANSITLLISSLLKIILILINSPLIYFAYAYAFDSLVLALGYLYYYIFYQKSINGYLKISMPYSQVPPPPIQKFFFNHFKITTAKQLLQDSWPLILSGLVITIYMRIDQVMIKELLNDKAVGIYSAAVRISEAWYFVPTVICSSLFPAIVSSKKHSEELYYTRLQKLYDLMVMIALAVALPITFLSDWIINILYGHAYFGAGKVLMIHIWAGVFVGLGVANSKWLLNENLQVFSIINTAIGAVVNISMNYFLITRIGAIGAAWATLFSYFIAAYLSLSFWDKTRISFMKITESLVFVRYLYDKKNY